MGNSKKFPISQKAHSLYEKIIFCHRPLLVPADEEDSADKPVDGHSNPDTEDSHMEHHGQQVAETKPEHPHGEMESTMVTFTSAAARSVFGSVKDSGQIVTTQAA